VVLKDNLARQLS